MSQNTQDKIKARNVAQQKAAETNDSDDWAKYKALRNSVTSTLKTEKRKWQQRKLEDIWK